MKLGRAMVLGVLLVGLTGCKRMSTDAKEQFAKAHSCPEDRVTIKEREDLSPVAVLAPPGNNASPPPDVKSDPGRLAKWEADQKADRARLESSLKDGYTLFEASGCGTTALMACTHGEQLGAGTSSTVVICSEKPLPR